MVEQTDQRNDRFPDQQNAHPPKNYDHAAQIEPPKSHAQSLNYAFNRIIINLARILLISLLLTLLVQAFGVDFQSGIRSLVAIILPPFIITYIAFRVHSPKPKRWLLDTNLYIFAALWMFLLQLTTNYVINRYGHTVPYGEITFSGTLSILVFWSGSLPFQKLVAASHGVIVGVLIYTLIFGFRF